MAHVLKSTTTHVVWRPEEPSSHAGLGPVVPAVFVVLSFPFVCFCLLHHHHDHEVLDTPQG